MSPEPLSLLTESLNSRTPFFLDISEDSFIQVSRDFFDDVRITFIVGGDYVVFIFLHHVNVINDIAN